MCIKYIPKVSKCCHCIDLRVGTMLIAIIGIIFMGAGLYPYYAKCEKSKGITKFKEVFEEISRLIKMIVLASSIVLLIGVFKYIPVTASIFIYAVLVSIVVYIFYVIVLVMAGIMDPDCGIKPYELLSAVVSPLIWCYFVVVVKSFREKILEEFDVVPT